MGDTAELMMDGTLCSECSVFIDDEAEGYVGACGYPRYCRRCGGMPEMNGQKPHQDGRTGRRKRRRR